MATTVETALGPIATTELGPALTLGARPSYGTHVGKSGRWVALQFSVASRQWASVTPSNRAEGIFCQEDS